jgi:hypothetical protein
LTLFSLRESLRNLPALPKHSSTPNKYIDQVDKKRNKA